VKKVISLALIVVLLTNTLGYYAIFLGLQYNNNVKMTLAFDADQYDESKAITIKIPMSIPYLQDDEDFERIDGTYQYKGEFYRLIKQKYAQEMLTVICIKDSERKRISEAITDYVMSFTDSGGDNNVTLKISFIKDYIAQVFEVLTTANGWSSDVVESITSNNLKSSFTVSVIHPPEVA
jgi:hypothetical protein